MPELISIMLIDGRPVRRRRFIQSLEIASDIVVVATLSVLDSFEEQVDRTPAQVIVVDGLFTDSPQYPAFEKTAHAKGCAVVPIWDYPTAKADHLRKELLSGARQKDVATADTRLVLFLETLRRAARDTPKSRATRAFDDSQRTLVALQTPQPAPIDPDARTPLDERVEKTVPPTKMIGIGASTGGVQALSKVLGAIDGNSPPIMLVQHMPHEFMAGFADRLDRLSGAKVVVAEDGMTLANGHVYVAPGDDRHMRLSLRGQPHITLKRGDTISGHVPSVDALFESMTSLGPQALCALLTGMGVDGARGMAQIKAAGGSTAAQNEATCTVFGMPREAIDMGGADIVLPIEQIASWLMAKSEANQRPARMAWEA